MTDTDIASVNAHIEHVFGITVRRPAAGERCRPLVYLEDIAHVCPNGQLTVDNLDLAVFERVLLGDARSAVLPETAQSRIDIALVDQRLVHYLYGAFERNARRPETADAALGGPATAQHIDMLILRNIMLAVKQPELYEGQHIAEQVVELFRQHDADYDLLGRLLSEIVRRYIVEPGADDAADVDQVRAFFGQLLAEIRRHTRQLKFGTIEPWVLPTLTAFACDRQNPTLALLLIVYNQPTATHRKANGALEVCGHDYVETLFGDLLRLSIMPKTVNGRAEHFLQAVNTMDAKSDQLWTMLSLHHEALHALFRQLLAMGGAVRAQLLQWLADCLRANATRGQLWNAHMQANLMGAGQSVSACDAFMLTLSAVLLRLCEPLARPKWLVLNVDASYSAVPEDQRPVAGVHMHELDKDTALIKLADDDALGRPTADAYNFVTECFFLTHRALDLGYRVCVEKYVSLHRNLRRMQTMIQTAMDEGEHGSHETNAILDELRAQVPMIVCLQNTLLEPTFDERLVRFYEATAVWLTQIASRNIERHAERGFAPVSVVPFALPLAGRVPVPRLLSCVPEFIVENIINYLTFIRHFEGQNIDMDADVQSAFFTLLLVFMGDAERVLNPHVRARMAEGLEALLPREFGNSFMFDMRANLYTQHEHRAHCAEVLLKVFVDIEMTGQSVQFEQKFNYRRPMYMILKYLWKIPEQQQCFTELAELAERSMENVDPPVFLRFVNLLINDAIFLLDESLSNLQQLRTLQNAEGGAEWSAQSATERAQHNANVQHIGQMARFDNILGRDTIRTLILLTSRIQGIFCHASMRERVAAMLNYFLLHLVGPDMRNFKVRNPKEYEFDPADTVTGICQIYINLQSSEAFALAVSQDGRSYSSELFGYALRVLERIGGGSLIGELKEFAQKVSRLEQEELVNQEALADAPDEFLDPIMSTLMLDPVCLPSSHVTVDRTTIARHLLSDQSDPFNRSPLTMDQVKSDVDLRAKIEAWMAEKRSAAAAAAATKAQAESKLSPETQESQSSEVPE